MRRLLPSAEDGREEVDLREAYAFPEARPWVRANMVASADGSAVVAGRSEALSGPADKRVFGVLRGLCDVVLVGAGTARAEGYRAPKARATYAEHRAEHHQRPAPVLALVSASLELDPGSDLFTGPERTVVLTSTGAHEDRLGALADVAEVVVCGEDGVDAGSAVDALMAMGLPRILCEGGPRLLADVARSGRLDELCLTTSPRLVGGQGPRILSGPDIEQVQELELTSLLEEDGNLFARYLVRR